MQLSGFTFNCFRVPHPYHLQLPGPSFKDTQEVIHLYQAIDRIKGQFGEKLLMKARGTSIC